MLSEFSDHRMRLRNNHQDEKSSVSKVTIKSSGSYTFRVEGYSGLTSNVGESVESPEFTLCDRVWQIRIFPGGSLEKHKNYISYYIASKSPESAKASYKLSICSQVYGGLDACFTSAGIRSFEARGTRIDGNVMRYIRTVRQLSNIKYSFIPNEKSFILYVSAISTELNPQSYFYCHIYSCSLNHK